MLDNHISVKHLMSKNDNLLIICVMQCTRLLKKANAAFDQGRGFERGRGGNLPSLLMAILTHML